MIPIIGASREMASVPIETIPLPRWGNITNLIGGYNQTNSTPDWSPNVMGILSVYPDYLGPAALVMMFSIPFFMMWLSHGNMKLIGFIGLVVGVFVFAYLPPNYMLASIIFIIISSVAILWGLFKQ